MGKIVTTILSVWLVLCIGAGCLLGLFLFYNRETVSYDLNEWDAVQQSNTYLPSVAQLGEYTDVQYKYLRRECFIYLSDAYTLRASYAPEEFAKMTDWIDSTYIFQETVINEAEVKSVREASFTIDDFRFRMLSLDEYDLYYPKRMAFIGVSDEKREIAFVYFYDFDLDYISDSLADFLVEDCGWE